MQVQLQLQIAANLLPSRGWACTLGLWMTTFDHTGLVVAGYLSSTSWDPTQVDCSRIIGLQISGA